MGEGLESFLSHAGTAVAFAGNFIHNINPLNFRVQHRTKSVNDLVNIEKDYDIIFLDRDITLAKYHGPREPEFDSTLERIANKSELVSNSSFMEFLKIGSFYSKDFPVSKVVKFKGMGDKKTVYALRIKDNKLSVFRYDPTEKPGIKASLNKMFGEIVDYNAVPCVENVTKQFVHKDNNILDSDGNLRKDLLKYKISKKINKINPLVFTTVKDVGIFEGRYGRDPKTLAIGDLYTTDVMGANRAGIHAAINKPFHPLSDKWYLIPSRYILNNVYGELMSRIGNSLKKA